MDRAPGSKRGMSQRTKGYRVSFTPISAYPKSSNSEIFLSKHPAYGLVRGSSGKGLTTGYFPEISSAVDYTANVSTCVQYDQLHVDAFLDWLDGNVPTNSEGPLEGAIPAIFGGNFQSVSVGQKKSGYVAGSWDFPTALETAVKFVDDSLGLVVNKLKAKSLYDETLIIVCSKHG